MSVRPSTVLTSQLAKKRGETTNCDLWSSIRVFVCDEREREREREREKERKKERKREIKIGRLGIKTYFDLDFLSICSRDLLHAASDLKVLELRKN